MYSCGPLHMDEQRKDDQLEHTYSSSVPIWDVALKTCRKQWTIENGGERGSRISALMAWYGDIYIYCLWNLVKGKRHRLEEVEDYENRYIVRDLKEEGRWWGSSSEEDRRFLKWWNDRNVMPRLSDDRWHYVNKYVLYFKLKYNQMSWKKNDCWRYVYISLEVFVKGKSHRSE